MAREKIELTDNVMDVVVKMSEGNPGGLSVLTEILKKEPTDGFFTILTLDDMNIRGTQIWIGYKDHCNSDLDVFIKAVKDRDQAMVDKINEVGAMGNHEEIAKRHRFER